jgi:hypothetical protein
VTTVGPVFQPDPAAQLRPALVHDRRADVGQRVRRVGQPVPLADQTAERVVHGVFSGRPAAEHDRSDPDQVHAVRAIEHGDLVGRGRRAGCGVSLAGRGRLAGRGASLAGLRRVHHVRVVHVR